MYWSVAALQATLRLTVVRGIAESYTPLLDDKITEQVSVLRRILLEREQNSHESLWIRYRLIECLRMFVFLRERYRLVSVLFWVLYVLQLTLWGYVRIALYMRKSFENRPANEGAPYNLERPLVWRIWHKIFKWIYVVQKTQTRSAKDI